MVIWMKIKVGSIPECRYKENLLFSTLLLLLDPREVGASDCSEV